MPGSAIGPPGGGWAVEQGALNSAFVVFSHLRSCSMFETRCRTKWLFDESTSDSLAWAMSLPAMITSPLSTLILIGYVDGFHWIQMGRCSIV